MGGGQGGKERLMGDVRGGERERTGDVRGREGKGERDGGCVGRAGERQVEERGDKMEEGRRG